MMVAFVSLLVGRQVLVFAAALYQNASFLYSNQSRVNALFDADAPWMPSPRKDDGFQNLLDPGRRKLWVGALLSAHGDFTGQELDIHCRSAEGGKLIYMTVVSGDQGSERAYFLKLYHRSLDALAQHEVEVLQVAGQSWPVPRLLGCESVEGNNCLAFEWAPTMSWLC